MKLKIHDNSIRLRLRRSEIARFGESGRVEGIFAFGQAPDQQIVYALVASDSPSEVAVQVASTHITVSLPRSVASELVQTDRVGVSGEQPIGQGHSVSILVEKEFRRVHGQNQDPDLYPNPLEKTTAQA